MDSPVSIAVIGAGLIGHRHVKHILEEPRCRLAGVIEAWGNLYTEFAMAVAARRDGVTPPADWLNYPTVEHGAQGVRFIDAAVESNKAGGAWVNCRLKLQGQNY